MKERGAKVTVQTLRKMKAESKPITMVTAYDATFARLVDKGGADVILVGDSLGMVIQGQSNTLPVTLDEMIYHTRAVSRGATRAHVVGDMPFLTYQGDKNEALKNAGRLLKEGGAESVKLEGGQAYVETIELFVRAGIPVMGHLGLTPQSIHAMGGYRVQGKEPDEARAILRDAKALEEAGVYAIVLEGIPRELARIVTRAVSVPTIGIGAGPECDGQVLVIYDLLGMNTEFKPKFVKHFLELGKAIPDAVQAFAEEVRAGSFPADEHSYHAKAPLLGVVESKAPDRGKTADEEAIDGLYGVPV